VKIIPERHRQTDGQTDDLLSHNRVASRGKEMSSDMRSVSDLKKLLKFDELTTDTF